MHFFENFLIGNFIRINMFNDSSHIQENMEEKLSVTPQNHQNDYECSSLYPRGSLTNIIPDSLSFIRHILVVHFCLIKKNIRQIFLILGI